MTHATFETLIAVELDADGVLLARIDMPGRAMNVFSKDLMDALEALILRAERDDSVRAVVLTSGKPAFLAGADLEMIKTFTERAKTDAVPQLNALFGHLGRLFRRLEQCPKPFVAAINGLALGGGLEVALACHARVVADDEKAVQLGLPEIKLGLLPGAGGTQRLPRLIGTGKGLTMLLGGEPVGPAEALALKLVDAVVPAAQLIATACRLAKARASAGAPVAIWDRPGARFPSAPFDFTAADAPAAIAKAVGISAYQLRHYPAYTAIIDCVVGGWNLPMTAACEREMEIFVELLRDPVAGNMVRSLFLNRQKAARLGLLAQDSPLAADQDALLPRVKAATANAGDDETAKLLAATLAALRVRAASRLDVAPELADVAVVNAGLFPAYAGGPFTHARHLGADALRRHAAVHDAGALPAIEHFFAAAAHGNAAPAAA